MTLKQAQERRRAAQVALGKESADLVLRGGDVVNVHTGRIEQMDVAVAGPRIASVGSVEAQIGSDTQVIDCSGLTLLPGFIDAHIHVGGSQLTMQRLAEAIVPCGTAAICTDFYEIGTMAGADAVLEELTSAEDTGLDILFSPFFAAVLGLGQFGNLERISYEDLLRLMEHEACVELREWNCWADAIPLEGQQQIYEAALRLGRTLGGHLEGLRGANLEASVALGAVSDHEAISVEEALERVKHGVVVQIREGSGATDFDDLLPALVRNGADPAYFAFATDEQELWSIAQDGHIDRLVRRAVRCGVAPLDAVRMATLNAARSIGVADNYGSVAPGRVASVVAVEDLATFTIRMVVSRGQLAAQDGEYLLSPSRHEYGDGIRQTIHVNTSLKRDDFLLHLPEGGASVRIIGVTPGKLVTEELVEHVETKDGQLVTNGDLAKIAVIDRHEGGDRRALGLIRGYDIRRGAFAASVNPGMMNVMVLGVDEGDMAIAVNRVVKLGGGLVVALDSVVTAELALPIYGIVSDEPAVEVAAASQQVVEALRRDLGTPVDGLLTSAGFACLAVSIPSLKICDRGLVRVARDGAEAIPLIVDE